MKSEKLNFKIMNCEADKANAMEKLKSRLKSLMSDMQYEIEKIEKEKLFKKAEEIRKSWIDEAEKHYNDMLNVKIKKTRK